MGSGVILFGRGGQRRRDREKDRGRRRSKKKRDRTNRRAQRKSERHSDWQTVRQRDRQPGEETGRGGFFIKRAGYTDAKMFKRGLRFGLFDCLIFGVFCVWFAFVDRPGSAATRRGGRRPYPEWARRGSAYSPAQSRRSVLQSVAKHQSTCATHEQKERLHTAYVVCVMGKGGGGAPRLSREQQHNQAEIERCASDSN